MRPLHDKDLRAASRRAIPVRELRSLTAEHFENAYLCRLNAQPRTESVKRVELIIQLMKEADELRRRICEKHRQEFSLPEGIESGHLKAMLADPPKGVRSGVMPDWFFTDLHLQTLNFELMESLSILDVMLQRYNWSPAVSCADFVFLDGHVKWNTQNPDENWENGFVWRLMKTIEGGGFSPSEIQRFRQCRECKRWFYSITDRQQNCSAACRKKFYSKSEQSRLKQAKYMRERYRPQQKAMEEKLKQTARKVLRDKGAS